MPLISIPAHFDGQHILLDQEVSLPTNTRLIVTVLDPEEQDRLGSLALASTHLADSYGEDEIEYTIDDCKN